MLVLVSCLGISLCCVLVWHISSIILTYRVTAELQKLNSELIQELYSLLGEELLTAADKKLKPSDMVKLKKILQEW